MVRHAPTQSPQHPQVPAPGGSASFSVATGAACAWTASSSETWLTVGSGSSGTGTGTVTLTAAANTGAARNGTATIAGQTVTVNQAAGGTGGGGTGLMIDAKSNIFASGRATAFDGLLPPSVRLAAGTGRVVTVTNATGTVRCFSSAAATGPDGGTEGSTTGTDISSYRGISGVIHTRKTMFLVGVFLTDAEPADPAPARLDFSNNEAFATLAPVIGQTFFIGDGMTGTGAGGVQQFMAPDSATRLFLGFADAYWAHGAPGFYGDNSGSLGVTVNVAFGGAGCIYSVSPATLTVAAAGGSSTIAVTTAAACAWTASSSETWLTVAAGASGTGNGTVTLTAAANAGAARSGTATIAGQTVTVNQAAGGGGTACTYSIAPGSATFPPSGGTGRIDITTQSGCAWTATATASWITFTAGQSGTGSGAVSYAVSANAGSTNRLGTISVAGKNHPVEQAGTAPASTVVIAEGGVVDTASFSPGLAPGSLFSIFGTDLAATIKQADSLPLPVTLEGVTVEVIDGATTMKAPLFFVSPGQVNGQLPYDLKGTSVQLRVRNSKGDSAPATVAIAPRAPRLFPWEGTNAIVVHNDYRLVTAQAPAMPGEYLIAFLVGMGPVNPPVAAGVAAPVSTLSSLTEKASIRLGGVEANVLFSGLAPYYVGLYQVNFQMPQGVAPGRMMLEVTVGAFSAQSDLSIACDVNWQAGASGTIAAAGGQVRSGALTLTVPAGAWNTSQTLQLAESASGTEWRLTGVPASTARELEIAVELKTALPEGGVAFLLAGDAPGDERLIRATVEGGTVRAILPVRPAERESAAAKGQQRAAATDRTELFVLSFVTGMNQLRSESGLFEILYSVIEPKSGRYDREYAKSLLENVAKAANALVAGFWFTVELGFAEPGLYDSLRPQAADGSREPMLVQVVHQKQLGRRPLAEPFGDIRKSSWDGSRLILLEYEKALASDVNQSYGRPIHVLFHLIQQYFDPADPLTSPWLWFHEASANLVERAVEGSGDYIPALIDQPLPTFLSVGLNEPASGSKVREYGAGASLFLEDLWREDGRKDLLHRIYRMRLDSWPLPIRPWDTLAKRTERWIPFVRQLATGTLARGYSPLGFKGQWKDVVNLSEVIRGARSGLEGENLLLRNLNSWSAMPILMSYLQNAPPAGTGIIVNVAGESAQVDAYFMRDVRLTSNLLGTAPPPLTLQARTGENVLLFLIQGKSSAPNGQVAAAVSVVRADTQKPPWPSPGPTTMKFHWAVPIRCETLPLAQCGSDRIDTQNYPSRGVSIVWNYPSFRITGQQSQDGYPTTFYVDGQVDLAKKTIEGVFDFRSTTGGSTYQLRTNLSALACAQFDESTRYGYRCSVRNADLRAAPANYVTGLLYEQYQYDAGLKREVLVGSGTPQYSMLTGSGEAIVIEFAGAK